MVSKLVTEYERGGEKLKKAVAGLEKKDLLWVPAPDAGLGKWSIQQIIIHLLDADVIWASRMKSIIAEDHPTMLGFDEGKFAGTLCYNDQDADLAIRLFDLNRRQFCKVLRKLPDSALARTGQHSERGSITLGQSLQGMVEHVDHHLDFIRRKRAALNKPMKD